MRHVLQDTAIEVANTLAGMEGAKRLQIVKRCYGVDSAQPLPRREVEALALGLPLYLDLSSSFTPALQDDTQALCEVMQVVS